MVELAYFQQQSKGESREWKLVCPILVCLCSLLFVLTFVCE